MPRATPWEHLQLSARLRRLTDWEDRARDLLERFELGDVAHRVTTGFSHGMGRRLSVCLAALHEPEVLLLDEPFDGVDPIGVDATFDVINDARARGACVLVSTHLRELAVQACTSVLVLRGGAQVAVATAGEMAGEEGAVPTAASWTEVRRAVNDVALPHRLPHHDRPPAARLRAGRRGLRRPHPRRRRRCPRWSRAPAPRRDTPSTPSC